MNIMNLTKTNKMKKAKKTIKEMEVIDSVTVKKPKFEIVKNGHCYELYKIEENSRQKMYVKSGTNEEDFTIEAKKMIKLW